MGTHQLNQSVLREMLFVFPPLRALHAVSVLWNQPRCLYFKFLFGGGGFDILYITRGNWF